MEPTDDAWKRTDIALSLISKLFDDLHDRKPDKNDKPAMTFWNAEHREVELWAHQIGARRFALVRAC